ncbi:ABC transporter substrate-binding protein [Mameliella sediminis]|uniref:ABC transporter substrate-binding protein n=1 Tax=Mameliella sediminis TaxID=2836866 RepID=UPI001C47161F|nr:ABC transporter substrate-binding protein [Mameliella sediminis]MBV7396909.1 ABC transporter substrate-binding protein [Mameliella sediminis]
MAHHDDETTDAVNWKTINQHDRDMVQVALKTGANRRQVMGWLMAAGMTVGAAGAVVGSAQRVLADTPKRGGTLRFAWDVHGPGDTLDPNAMFTSLDFARGRMTYNNLVRMQEDLTVGPELATEWAPNKDATEWTFKLRQGVEFHDGSLMTADDVIYSMNRHLGQDTTSRAKSQVSDVKEWVKVDNETVKAVLTGPNAELPIILGMFHFKVIKDGTTEFQTAIGTGPYQLREFSPGVRAIHVRNDNYWNSDVSGPYMDRIESFAITDAVARTNALIAGDIHMMGSLNANAIGQIEASGNASVFTVPSGKLPEICIATDRDPGNNPDFVMGMKLLQRRDRVLNVVQKGIGTLANDQPIGPAYGEGWCSEVNDPARDYDPEQARFYLDRSGVTGAELHVAEVVTGISDISLILQREAQKIGFDLRIKKVPNDGYWGAVWGKTPMFVSGWNMRPSASIQLGLSHHSAGWNPTKFKNERFDSLLDMVRGEVDASKRKEMLCEAQKLVAEEAGSLIPTHVAYLDALASDLRGLPRVPLAGFGGMEWPEFIWRDA